MGLILIFKGGDQVDDEFRPLTGVWDCAVDPEGGVVQVLIEFGDRMTVGVGEEGVTGGTGGGGKGFLGILDRHV